MWVHKKCSGVKGRLKVDSDSSVRNAVKMKQLLELKMERKRIYFWKAVNQLSVLRSFAILGICLIVVVIVMVELEQRHE